MDEWAVEGFADPLGVRRPVLPDGETDAPGLSEVPAVDDDVAAGVVGAADGDTEERPRA